MIVGIPVEVKNREYRVGMVPAGIVQLKQHGHQVIIEKDAGVGSGFTDEEFIAAGAEIVDTAEEVWKRADMIIKVKEPVASEYPYFRDGLMLFTYLHLAAVPELTRALEMSGVSSVAYETIQLSDSSLPLLKPMSEIAGRIATQKGATYLEKANGGRGVLLGGVPGTRRGKVAIIGGGVVGTNAAQIAVGMGAEVTLLDINLDRLEYLDHIFQGRLNTLYSNPGNIAETVEQSDLVVGAVLIPGAKAPHLVTEEMVATMAPGAVIVDVAIDQGGCIETVKPTTHDDPIYLKHDVVHYCVTNMPGAVSRTSTLALTNATTRYALKLADLGLEAAIREDHSLFLGVNSYKSHITYEAVAEACGVEYKPLSVLL